MPTQAEYREFFLRATKVVVGSKADKETNFPTQYMVTDLAGNQIMGFNRFLKTHFPSEDVFKKLFESITFKLNPEDTASQSTQGLVRIVTGVDNIAGVDARDGFTNIVVPSALPIVGAGTNITIDVEIVRAVDDVVVGSIPLGDLQIYYLRYIVNSTAVVNSSKNIDKYFTVPIVRVNTLPLDSDNADLVVLGIHTIPANTLVTPNDTLEYDLLWIDNSDTLINRTLEVYVGNSTKVSDCVQVLSYKINDLDMNQKFGIGDFKIKVIYRAKDGFFVVNKNTFYKPTTGMTLGVTTSMLGGLATDVTDVATRDTGRLSFIQALTNLKVDWTATMYVHFRYKLEGFPKAESAHNYFDITGKAVITD